MVYAVTLLSSLLLASAAFASPSSNGRLASRLERRREGRQSQPMQSVDPSEALSSSANSSHVSYSTNWAGAVFDSKPKGTFTAVTGTFTVPTPTGKDGAASAWVGIDGDTCGSAILQTGVDFTISGGEVSYDAWYEWYPAVSHDFSGIDISAGDEITVTVTSSTTKAGKAVIENKTTGKTVTKSLTSTAALCQENAEWIVEDFEEGSSLVPFANFDKVVFSDAKATTSSGSIGPSGASILDIKQSSKVLTSASADSSSVTVSYV